jgi:L-seryl-tRNA(Ser) seleniumtransferase
MSVTPDRGAQWRQLPSLDELLRRPALAALAPLMDRAELVATARQMLEQARAAISSGHGASVDSATIETRLLQAVRAALLPSLRSVINATGVILHTNLGRAPLPENAMEHLREAATQYSNLEYDLAIGARGKRDVHTAGLLARLTGAESAIVVNNNAAALLLVLNTLAKGSEVIVSRGELVEIGDGFRIPEVMSESGAVLREVGTTNRTTIRDFERAINERTRLLLRVHPSNFKIVGFTARPSLGEMVELGRRTGLPVLEDLGSGCLVDLSPFGFDEPVVRASFAAGVPLACFSADKLLGGPQAGIIAGQRELVERIRRNPLFRALRVDKLAIAALEATLLAYLRGALDDVPALRMVRMPLEEVTRRAEMLAEKLRAAHLPETEIEIRHGQSLIGGGSTPEQHLPTCLVSITTLRYSAAKLEERLRRPAGGTPVIARVEDDRLVLDLRTVFLQQEELLRGSLCAALRQTIDE